MDTYILQKNGIDSLDDMTFLKDNVYLITKDEYDSNLSEKETEELRKTNVIYAFCHWMKRLHPEYEMKKTDEICEGAYVYQFQRE
jgi:hypothetical protein